MSMKYLGETIDIHGGGKDLIFPHHENEIALKQLLDNYHPDVIRLALLQNSYKSDLNIIDGIFEENEKHIYNFYKLFNAIDNLKIQEGLANAKQSNDLQASIETAFNDAMSNDFNTALAIS